MMQYIYPTDNQLRSSENKFYIKSIESFDISTFRSGVSLPWTVDLNEWSMHW